MKKKSANLYAPIVTRAQMNSRKLKTWNPRAYTLDSHDLQTNLRAYIGNDELAHELFMKMIDRGTTGVHYPPTT